MNPPPLPKVVRRETVRLGARTLDADRLATGEIVYPTERLAARVGIAPGELCEALEAAGETAVSFGVLEAGPMVAIGWRVCAVEALVRREPDATWTAGLLQLCASVAGVAL